MTECRYCCRSIGPSYILLKPYCGLYNIIGILREGPSRTHAPIHLFRGRGDPRRRMKSGQGDVPRPSKKVRVDDDGGFSKTKSFYNIRTAEKENT